MSIDLKIAIYGYDTIVGKMVLECLEDSSVVVDELFPLSPIPVEYDAVPFRGKNNLISYVDDFDFSKADVALFLTTKDESERLIQKVQTASCIVIDNSHLYSGIKGMPVIMSEINPFVINEVLSKKIAIVPSAISSELALALSPVHDEFGISRAIVTALVSVSEHGELGTQTLARETTQLLNGVGTDDNDFLAQLAFNVHPQIGKEDEAGNSEHENIVLHELFSLLDPFKDGMSLNCVQVPIFYGHSLFVHVDLEEDCSLEDFIQVFKNNEHIQYHEDKEQVITPVTCAELDNKVFVTRVRKQGAKSFDFAVVMDNIRRGEASGVIGILSLLQKHISA